MATVTEAVRRLTIEATTRGVKEAAAATRDLSGAVDGVAVSSQRAERATQSMESRLGTIQRRYDEVFRSQQAMARVERDLVAAQAQGLITAQRRMELLSLAAERHGLATAAVMRETAAIERQTTATNRLASANDNVFRRRNLTYQVFDVGQGLALGSNPALIAMQQGPQIAQLYAGPGGVNAALKDTGALLSTIVTRFGPVALAAGVAALAIGDLRADIERTSGVAVTFGDVTKAIFQTIGGYIYDFVRPAIDAIAPWFNAAWESVKSGTATAINFIVRGVGIAVETIKFAIGAIPDAFKIAGEEAANAFLSAIEWMIRSTIEGMNTITGALSDTVNVFVREVNRIRIDNRGGMGALVGSMVGGRKPDWLLDEVSFGKIDPNSVSLGRINLGAADAMKSLATSAKDYQDTVADIAEKDYLGQFLDDVAGQSVKNAAARLAELEEKTKKAGDAAKKAVDPWKDMRKANSDWADAMERARQKADEAAQSIEQTLGGALAGLFDGPIKDADEFFAKLTSGFASFGQQNISSLFDGMLRGGAANDNGRGFANLIGAEVQKGATAGTMEGSQAGLTDWFKSIGMSQGGATKATAGIGAAIGGFGIGQQTQDPFMGAIGGALSGFSSGAALGAGLGPIGAVIGGAVGLISGLFAKEAQKRKEREEAKAQLEQNRGSINTLIDRGMGRGIGGGEQAYRDFREEQVKASTLAMKAGDWDLARQLDEAVASFNRILRDDFLGSFNGTLEAMKSGLGPDSPFVQAQQSVIGMREQLKGFVADARFFGASVGAAQKAAQAYALSQLTGAKELSPMQGEMERLKGTASALTTTLVQLGMTSSQAAAAIRDSLTQAIGDLRKEFVDDLTRSINDLSGKSYLNDLLDAQKRYNERLKDAAALGLSSSLAQQEYNLALGRIATDAGLAADTINDLSGQFPGLASSAASALADIRREFAKTLDSFWDSLQINKGLSILSPAEQLAEAKRQFESTSAAALGGDRTAMDALQGTISAYLDQAKAFFASSQGYVDAYNAVGMVVDQVRGQADQSTAAQAAQQAAVAASTATAGAMASAMASAIVATIGTATQPAATQAAKAAVAAAPAAVVSTVPAGAGMAGSGQYGSFGRFASGGYTGDIGTDQIAGVVHGREFVNHAAATARYRPELEAMNAGRWNGGNDNRSNLAELGRMISAAVSSQTETLSADLSELRDEFRRASDETRIAASKKQRRTG